MIERLDQQGQHPVTGDIEVKWRLLAKVYASVEPLSVRAYLQSAMTQKEISTRMVMRHRDVATNDRVVYRGMVYQIQGVLPDAKSGREYITLLCLAGG